MAAAAFPLPLADTQACKMAGNLDGFVLEVMVQVRTLLNQLQREIPITEPMSEADVRRELNRTIETVMRLRLDEELAELTIDPQVEQLIFRSWANEFSAALTAQINRK